MYFFKEIDNLNQIFRNKNITRKEAAEEIGIAKETLSRILNRRRNCTKVTAYAITIFFDKTAKIEDYFTKVEKKNER